MAINVSVELVTEECPRCHILFAVTGDFQRRRLQDSRTFYCPQGHSQSYTDGENDRLKRQLKAAQQAIEMAEQRHGSTRRDLITEKQQHGKTRAKLRRTAAGVCPHCTRNFQDLARHMKTKHPEHVSTCRESAE